MRPSDPSGFVFESIALCSAESNAVCSEDEVSDVDDILKCAPLDDPEVMMVLQVIARELVY